MLANLYGDSCGGSLLGGALKLATLVGCHLWGLYDLIELSQQPEVHQAKILVPGAEFFMDASNIWFYGYEDNYLLVYDAELHEIDTLGPLENALDTVFDQWEAVQAKLAN